MPGGDGRGPRGQGPMTGRAAGYCASYSIPGSANPIYGRGQGYGRGMGRGFGGGRGFGRGRGFGAGQFGYPYYGNPIVEEYTPEQEADMLKQEAKAMQEEISSINARISELESVKKDKKK